MLQDFLSVYREAIITKAREMVAARPWPPASRISSESRVSQEVERLGHLAHEIRSMLHTAMLALDIVRRGTVSVNGSTGAVLARSLVGIQNLVETTLTDVRLSANQQRREREAITTFLEDIAVAARLDADHRGQHFIIEPIAPNWLSTSTPNSSRRQ